MTDLRSDRDDRPVPGPAARAAAAAWVARLHGPARSPAVEAGLQRWLAESPEHVAALERVTEVWEKAALLKRRPLDQLSRWEQVGFRLRFSRAALAAAFTCLAAVAVTLFFTSGESHLATGTGEQRTVTLEDGTRVHLNTRTLLAVRYERALRKVELTRGEALFEVAHNPARPFVVTAQGRRITALGTQFEVRSEPARLAVTLIEGKVVVAAASGETPAGVTLLPGQRVLYAQDGVPRIDRPALSRVTAWEHGEVAFDDTPLVEAASEMNRYSRTQLVLAGPGIGGIRISGIFQAGDLPSFAQALAAAYHLQVEEHAGSLTLESPSGRADTGR